jgi:hypothetical protein
MASRLRWFILGNLIGIIILVVGIVLHNQSSERQENSSAEQPASSTPEANR